MRVVIDAMVWARGLIARNPASSSARIIPLWKEGRFNALLSGELLAEVEGTLIELGASNDDVIDVLMLMAANAIVVPIQHQRMGCDDPEDDHLLETAVTGNADYLVSEDRAVYNLPAHVVEYLGKHGIAVRRAHAFLDEIVGSRYAEE